MANLAAGGFLLVGLVYSLPGAVSSKEVPRFKPFLKHRL